MAAMLLSSAGDKPAKSWQLRSAFAMATCRYSMAEFVDMIASTLRAPEIDAPFHAFTTFDLRLKAFAAEEFDQRRRQKRSADQQAFAALERIHAPANLRQRFESALQRRRDVQAFELPG